MMTREDYYAQIGDIYARIYGESHAPCLSYRSKMGKKEKHEDQALIEDGTVKREANAEVVSAIVKKEQIQEIQVPISKLEHGLQIHNASPIVCEDSQYVVGCDELCEHQRSILQVSHVKERNVLLKKSAGVTINQVAHQLFDQMPSKGKQRKCLKAWKFKFKPTSKRSRLRDDKFSFVDATVWLNKDLQEIIWDCVNKEFKETVAGCGKTRVDQFKLVLAAPRPGVYDRPLQTRVWDSGGSLLECVDEEFFGDDKIKEWLFKVEKFFSIDFTPTELKVKLVSNHFDGDAANWHQSQVQTGQFGHLLTDWGAHKIAVNANLGFSDYNNKRMKGKTELLATNQKMQKMDLFSIGIHTEMEENVELKQLLVAMERVSQEVIAQKIESGLSCGDVKFHLKHKWRFRLLESFSRLVLLAWINLWLSKTYAFSGQLQDLRKGEAGSFPLLNFAAEPPFLWMENKSESVLTASAFERKKKKLCSKTWMFKYKVPHLAEKIFETSDQCIRKRGLVSADQETEDNQLILRSFMWVIQNCLNQYMVLLLASDAYDAQLSVGVGMNKKQLRLALQAIRVWDPGGSNSETD